MNHILYKDGILKAKPFKRLPCIPRDNVGRILDLFIEAEGKFNRSQRLGFQARLLSRT
jgi:hypothetical protein